jgi:hypothetical protein
VYDVNILDEIAPEAGAFYVMDRGYVDLERLYVFTLSRLLKNGPRRNLAFFRFLPLEA